MFYQFAQERGSLPELPHKAARATLIEASNTE